MKIVLALSAPPGSASGAASYAFNFKRELEKKSLAVKVVSYQKLVKLPQPFKLLAYFLKLLKAARQVDLIYSFNLISAGLPAGLVSFFLRKKLVLRIGGDYLWERAFEQGRTSKVLREYYQEKKTFKERCGIFCLNFVLKRADKVIFTTDFQRRLYLKHYKLTEQETAVIANPFPIKSKIQNPNVKSNSPNQSKPRTTTSCMRGKLGSGQAKSKIQILYAGRFLKLKNLTMLIDVFAQVLQKTEKPLTLKLIGQGPEENNLKFKIKNLKLEGKVFLVKPVAQEELWKETSRSWLCILPSLTDISPNFALEAIALEKPILLTKETGLYDRFKNNLIFIEPQKSRDLQVKLLALLAPASYDVALSMIKRLDKSYSWGQVISRHLEIFKDL